MSMHHLRQIGMKYLSGILFQDNGLREMKLGISFKLQTTVLKKHSTNSLEQTLMYLQIFLLTKKYLRDDSSVLLHLLKRRCLESSTVVIGDGILTLIQSIVEMNI